MVRMGLSLGPHSDRGPPFSDAWSTLSLSSHFRSLFFYEFIGCVQYCLGASSKIMKQGPLSSLRTNIKSNRYTLILYDITFFFKLMKKAFVFQLDVG